MTEEKLTKNNPKIFLATPMYGGQCNGEFMSSVLELNNLMLSMRWGFEYYFLYNESLITRARNSLAKIFLESDCTHLLFIDADISFNPHDVVKMVEENKELISGVVPAKEINWERIQNAVLNKNPNFIVEGLTYVFNVKNDEDGKVYSNNVKEVARTGTGYMLIKREVFEKVEAEEYILQSNQRIGNFEDKTVKNFFNTSIDQKTKFLLSEDYFFCDSWTNTGGKVYIAPYARAAHIGSFTYGYKSIE
jgi:hypothetical protein